MKIDFGHFQGVQIADTMMSILNEQQDLQIIEMLKPTLSLDGNQYCFTYGKIPNDCVQGFGETAAKAAYDFRNNWYNKKA